MTIGRHVGPDFSRRQRCLPGYLGVALGPVLLGVCISAGSRQSPQKPFEGRIDLFRIDVSVLDQDRRPIRGLRQEDFSLLEDGKPRTISTFAEVDVPISEPEAAWQRSAPVDVTRNDDLQDKRLFVLLLDDSMGPGGPDDVGPVRLLRQSARQIVDRLGPMDLAAVIYTLSDRWSQGFTADKSALYAAIDKYDRVPGPVDWYRRKRTLGALGSVIDSLTTVPDHRKAVFYLGTGISDLIDQAAVSKEKDKDPTFVRMVNELCQTARMAHIPVFPIQTSGVGGLMDFHFMLANGTGGFPLGAANDYNAAVQKVFDANASYYLIGYVRDDPTSDGRSHRLEVRVDRAGASVFAPSGYVAEPKGSRGAATTPATDAPELALRQVMAALLPTGDLPMQLSTTVLRASSNPVGTVAIVLGVRQRIGRLDSAVTERADVQIEAFTIDGRSRGSKKLATDVIVRPNSEGPIGYEVVARMDLPSGRYQLRVAARTRSDGHAGSVFGDITVPDFSRTTIWLSPPLFATQPRLASAPQRVFNDILPFVPTSLRDFTPQMSVVAVVQVGFGAQRGVSAVRMTTTILDNHDRVVLKDAAIIDAKAFNQDSLTTFEVAIPMKQLVPGSYLLRIGAEAGSNRQLQSARFEVGR